MSAYLRVLLVLLISLLGVAVAAQAGEAKINYREARELYSEFGKTLSAVGLWDKKTYSDRSAWYQAAVRQKSRVDRAFGEFSACSKTAQWHLNFITDLNQIAFAEQGGQKVPPRPLLFALAAAEQFGNHRAGCYEEVEALDVVKKKS